MAASSIVGKWSWYIDTNCDGGALKASDATFKADGTWSYDFGGGQWYQTDGLMALNFDSGVRIIYTGKVTYNAINGMWAFGPGGFTTGCFYMLRQPVSPLAAKAVEGAQIDPASLERRK